MLRRLNNRKGFTLVELMIVVAIIGILAAIAIPNFLNFRLKAKASEAKSNLGAVRSTEIAYYAEWNVWVGGQGLTPDATRAGNPNKELWDTSTRFSILGFAPEGKVYFSYQLEGAAYPVATAGFTGNAYGDLDNDNTEAIYMINTTSPEVTKSGGTF